MLDALLAVDHEQPGIGGAHPEMPVAVAEQGGDARPSGQHIDPLQRVLAGRQPVQAVAGANPDRVAVGVQGMDARAARAVRKGQ